MADRYDIRLFKPEEIYFSRGKGGVLQGVVDGKPYEELVIFRTFPFRYASEYISVRTTGGEELGIIRDIAELSAECVAELEKELQYRYFLPKVQRVASVKFKSDLWIWELETHLGDTRLTMRNLHEHLQFPGGNRIVLTDMHGKRCEIADWHLLDAHSRRQLEDVL
ncbi:uncharacterized protein DUF1854 [Paenibacillus sp. BK033]|uniref:DUF1854 domain-containing protein n=1 Tax=Paenibacillus sp. BK033 TaxID=2512133 RepID=UPI00104C5F03|nr:DUF1854 domain-containing protein [Paenibacillus sp. BK033]TCM99692.1 uncharacterized protein DUF1854 [Paenibacillus sp. BK033]